MTSCLFRVVYWANSTHSGTNCSPAFLLMVPIQKQPIPHLPLGAWKLAQVVSLWLFLSSPTLSRPEVKKKSHKRHPLLNMRWNNPQKPLSDRLLSRCHWVHHLNIGGPPKGPTRVPCPHDIVFSVWCSCSEPKELLVETRHMAGLTRVAESHGIPCVANNHHLGMRRCPTAALYKLSKGTRND